MWKYHVVFIQKALNKIMNLNLYTDLKSLNILKDKIMH